MAIGLDENAGCDDGHGSVSSTGWWELVRREGRRLVERRKVMDSEVSAVAPKLLNNPVLQSEAFELNQQ